MKKTAEKSLFARMKPFWDNGKLESAHGDAKIGFCIKNYAVNQIFDQFKSNKSVLNETEKKEFETMIRELAEEKKSLGKDNVNTTAEEYMTFLENTFSFIDNEDRNGEVSLKTSQNFKLLSELIDILATFGEIPEKWNKRSNFF